MLKELDQFIQFLIDHISDDRVSLSKKMKYGFRHYHLNFTIDAEPEDKTKSQNSFLSRFHGSVEIVFDNRNKCIEIYDHMTDDSLVLEDIELLEKWNPIFEEMVNQDLGLKVLSIMENALSSCYRKDLHREYKMKDIFDQDEDDIKKD